jgi:beta-xylosidase
MRSVDELISFCSFGKLEQIFMKFKLIPALLFCTAVLSPLSVQAGSNHSDNGDGTFTNPVIAADFPDIDVVRVGDTYYMLSTTMFIFPGVPLLKSKDLVNWEYCCNTVPRMDTSPCYNLEGCNRYGHGQWAGSLKYHDGMFYLLFNTLNEGGYLCTATNPEGSWNIRRLPRGFHDPGLFFDDDGRIYVSFGYNKLFITELDSNFAPIGKDSLVFTGSIRPGIEGSHVYKRNGYYYLYCTYGGGDGFQVALRSRNIYGPYEQQVVLRDKTKGVNFGVHQGALFETKTGEWWTLLFVDAGPIGRMPSLQPLRWVDDWPVAGVEGNGVVTYRKPDVGHTSPILDLPTSDEFSGNVLGMQWGWNHNPDDTKWSLTQRPGWLRLQTVKAVPNLKEARNTLTQRIFMNYDPSVPTAGVTKLDVSRMKDGDVAGLAVFQDPYAYIAIRMEDGKKRLIMVNDGEIISSLPCRKNLVYLKAFASNAARVATFQYSFNGKKFASLGNDLKMRFNLTIFTGNKFCLFNYASKETGGTVDFDFFRTDEGSSRKK